MKISERTCISNSLDLVHIKVVNDGIKACVQVVQEVHNLEWSAVAGNPGESHNVTGESKENKTKPISCTKSQSQPGWLAQRL